MFEAGDESATAKSRSDSERFSAASGNFSPVIPAQAGIQSFSPAAQPPSLLFGGPLNRAARCVVKGTYINAHAAKRLTVLKALLRRQQIKLPALPGEFD